MICLCISFAFCQYASVNEKPRSELSIVTRASLSQHMQPEFWLSMNFRSYHLLSVQIPACHSQSCLTLLLAPVSILLCAVHIHLTNTDVLLLIGTLKTYQWSTSVDLLPFLLIQWFLYLFGPLSSFPCSPIPTQQLLNEFWNFFTVLTYCLHKINSSSELLYIVRLYQSITISGILTRCCWWTL